MIYCSLMKRKEVQLDDKQKQMMDTIDDLKSMVEQLLLAQKGISKNLRLIRNREFDLVQKLEITYFANIL